MKKKLFSVVLLCVVGMLSPLALGGVVVDDHFDDGAIGTNTTGIGTGFNSLAASNGSVTEADSFTNLINIVNGAARVVITSKDGAAIGSGITRFEFKGVKFALSVAATGTGGPGRTVVAVKHNAEANEQDNNTHAGFYVQFENDSFKNTGNDGAENGTSALIYVAEDDTRTVLATWTFDTLNWDTGTQNFTPVLDVTLDLDATGYSLTIEGDTISNVTGALENTYAAAGITNELTTGYAFAFNQTEFPSINLSIDQIVVTEDVPTKIMINAPLNNSIHMPISQDLSWIVMEPTVEFIDLYFGTENDPNLSAKPGNKMLSLAPATTISIDPGFLDYSTTYYWRVDAYEPNTLEGATDYVLSPGSVWKFTTVGQSATVNAVSPAKTFVNPGTASVNLSVAAFNTTTYQWYKVGTPDVALTDGADYTGTTTGTLTIYDVQLADEGTYYCQVDNDLAGTNPVNSVGGLVMTNRLLIHYPLDTVDGTITPDIVGGYHMTLKSGDGGADLPSLAAGVPQLGGNAMLFNNRNPADPNVWGQYASAGDVDMEAMGGGLTVAFWVKWTDNNTTWQGIINRRGSWAANDMMWRIDKDPTSGSISFERANGGGRVPTTLVQGDWHYIVATYDIAAGRTKMYNNGVRVANATGFTYGTGSNSEFKLGRNNDGTNNGEAFCGLIDDVKIYNYARSAVQVAQDYANVMGTSVCNVEGTADMEFDTNGDCKIDLKDFAELAADWLYDNRIYPQ